MGLITSIFFGVIIAYVVYMCFERYDFKTGAIAEIVIVFVRELIGSGTDSSMLALIIVSSIVGLILAVIDYFIYLHSDSFIKFLIISIIVYIVLKLLLAMLAIGTVIGLVASIGY